MALVMINSLPTIAIRSSKFVYQNVNQPNNQESYSEDTSNKIFSFFVLSFLLCSVCMVYCLACCFITSLNKNDNRNSSSRSNRTVPVISPILDTSNINLQNSSSRELALHGLTAPNTTPNSTPESLTPPRPCTPLPVAPINGNLV